MTTENENTTAVAPETPKVPRIKGEDKKVKLSDVIKLLEEGKTRKEIKIALGLTNNQAKKLFGHEKIKGKKRHYTKNITKAEIEVEDDLPEIDLEDDTDEAVDPTAQISANGNGAEVAATEPVPQAAGTSDEW